MPIQQNKKSGLLKYLHIIIAVLIFTVFFGMLNQMPWIGTSIRDERGTLMHTENPWTLMQDDTLVASGLELPEYMPLESHKLYRLSTTLTYNGIHDTLPYAFLHLDHAYCRVLLDGRELFSGMPEDLDKWDASKSSGFIYSAIPLPHDCLGKTFTIEILPTLDVPIEYGLPEVVFGDYNTSLYASIFRDAPHNVVIIICALLGFASILFATSNLRRSDYRESISIGIFSLLFALYLITECHTNTFFIGNPYYLYLLNYIPFSLLPIALMGFMRERLPEKHQRLFSAIIMVELILFAIEMVLHFSGIYDMREVIPIIHFIYFANIITITVLILTMKERRRKRALVLQLIPVLIGMLLDACIYWLHLNIGINDATFTILGVLIFLIVEIYHIWKSSVSIYSESIRSKLYRQMAYVDDLTNVGNRRAYEEALQHIIDGKVTYSSMIVASADINDLKIINDHYGHAAGDEAIRVAAQIIGAEIDAYGKLYRIGGDEFAIFLYDISVERYKSIRNAVKEAINTFNQQHPYHLSLAVGYVVIHDSNILKAMKCADAEMYANKATYKSSAQ